MYLLQLTVTHNLIFMWDYPLHVCCYLQPNPVAALREVTKMG